MLDWNLLLDRVGIPGTLLVVMAYASYRVINWLGVHVFLPVTNRHLEFLNNLEKSLEASERFSHNMVQVQSNMDANLQKISTVQENMEACLQKLTLCQEKLTVYIDPQGGAKFNQQ